MSKITFAKVISLGCFCSPALWIKELGLRNCSYPLDWILTPDLRRTNDLIENNFINEERFAQSFVRGKHNYKFWGKNRIVNELKFRNISSRNIQTALKEIPEATYLHNFHTLAEKNWETIKDPKGQKRNKKFVDFLLRKGYETGLIYEKLNELNKD